MGQGLGGSGTLLVTKRCRAGSKANSVRSGWVMWHGSPLFGYPALQEQHYKTLKSLQIVVATSQKF